ncbi:MAG: hypothetical protein JKY65_28660 [Planctomycetes bacterium]|nr:hypothetical protein [Planctomycetota bacterium]
MKPQALFPLALLALVAFSAPALAGPLTPTLKLNGKDVFVDWEGYEPYYYCEYQGTPLSVWSPNANTTKSLVKGVVGVSKHRTDGTFAIVTTEVIETVSPHATSRETQQQFIGPDTSTDNSRKLRLVEKAPWFSMIGERATDFRIDKRRNTGSIRLRFWQGGSLFTRPYSNKRHELRVVRVNFSPPSSGSSGGMITALTSTP